MFVVFRILHTAFHSVCHLHAYERAGLLEVAISGPGCDLGKHRFSRCLPQSTGHFWAPCTLQQGSKSQGDVDCVPQTVWALTLPLASSLWDGSFPSVRWDIEGTLCRQSVRR